MNDVEMIAALKLQIQTQAQSIEELVADLEVAIAERDRYRAKLLRYEEALKRIACKCKDNYWAAIADNALEPKEVILSEEVLEGKDGNV